MTHVIRRAYAIGWSFGLTFLGIFAPAVPLALAADGAAAGPMVALAIALGVPWLWLLSRAARMRFVADERGLVVANFLRTRRLAWPDVAKLSTGPGCTGLETGAGRLEVAVQTRTGETIHATATNTSSNAFEDLVRRLVPVMELAAIHAVPAEWRQLTELQKLIAARTIARINAACSIAASVARASS